MKVTIETTWLNNNLSNNNVVIIDFSWYLQKQEKDCYKDFNIEHIPNSQFINLDNLSNQISLFPHMVPDPIKFEIFMRICGVNNNSTVIIYDTQGMYSSPRLWWMLKYFGHSKVYVLNGGLIKWKKEKKIVTSKITKNAYGNFKSNIKPKFISDKYDIFRKLNHINTKIIDARTNNRFLGKEKEPRKGLKRGNIPGSKNIHWKNLINDNHTLKSGEEIKRIFSNINLNKNNNIITTCGSGITACILNLALTKINFPNISVYDGSWSEWGSHKNFPIA